MDLYQVDHIVSLRFSFVILNAIYLSLRLRRRRQHPGLGREVLPLLADLGHLMDGHGLAAEDPVPGVDVDGVDGQEAVLGVVADDPDQQVAVLVNLVAGERVLPERRFRVKLCHAEFENREEANSAYKSSQQISASCKLKTDISTLPRALTRSRPCRT